MKPQLALLIPGVTEILTEAGTPNETAAL